jgi:ParB-like chromosome segregation protein Spo0J
MNSCHGDGYRHSTSSGDEPARAALEFHPLANLFPLIEGAEFDDLVADIKANGLREEIVLLDGRILDGRNRYRACVAGGIELRFRDFRPEVDGDPLAYVISKNLKRRHLDDSQRAMVAAAIANMRQGERTDLEPSANLPKVSQPQAAAMLSISERALRAARLVQTRGAPELVHAVERGRCRLGSCEGCGNADGYPTEGGGAR